MKTFAFLLTLFALSISVNPSFAGNCSTHTSDDSSSTDKKIKGTGT